MTVSRAEAPFLTKMSIANLVRLNQAQKYDQGGFPIQQLYMAGNNGNPTFQTSQTFTVEFERALRELGVLRSRLGVADVRPRNAYGQMAVTSVFQYAKEIIPVDDVARIRMIGIIDAVARTAAQLRQRSEQKVQRIIIDLTNRILRTWERHCVAMMTSPGTAALVIDGLTVQVETRLEAAFVTADDWALVGTDIPASMAKIQTFHERRSGQPTTHIIKSSLLREDLGKNDALRSFVDNNANRKGPITELPLDMFDASLQNAILINHRQFYFEETIPKSGQFDKQVDYWPHYTMVLLSLQDAPSTIAMGTTPTALDLQEGGMFTNRWSNQETGEEYVAVGANAVPYNMDTKNITVVDLTGP